MLTASRFSIVLTVFGVSHSLILGHESFLPLHEFHLHQEEQASEHEHSGKAVHDHEHTHGDEAHFRWKVASGARYTRLSLNGEAAHLWETALGIEVNVTPWMHIGADVAYGWFDSDEGSADGLMVPHAHVDFHFPLKGHWEVLAGFDAGFPGGDDQLVGDHWEFTPSVGLRYDRGAWFVATGVSFVFTEGHEHGHGDEADHDHEDGDSSHSETSFEEVVDPHGSRELHYLGAFGVRLLDQHLELESSVAGINVTSGDTPDRNYVRAGLRASWKFNDRWSMNTQGSVPITEARRNDWQASVGVRFSF